MNGSLKLNVMQMPELTKVKASCMTTIRKEI